MDRERERLGSFEQMKVWQEAHQLVLKVLDVTPSLPPDQQDGIALAMERTAIDVPKTIAEGFKRRGSRNKAHFYNLAQSHLEALRYYFILCRDLKYNIDYEDLTYRSEQVARMLDSLVRSMSRQGGPGGGRDGRGRGGPRRDGRDGGGRRDNYGNGGGDGYENSNDSDVSDDMDDVDDIGTGD